MAEGGTTWYGGVPWATTVLAAAERSGVADEVAAVALRYRSRHGSYHTTPNPHPRGGLIVSDGLHAAILSSLDIVVGFRAKTPEQAAADRAEQDAIRAAARGRGVARGRGGAGQTNPTSFEELIAMLAAEGYRTESGGSHILVLDPDGNQVGSIPRTASDHRNLANTVSDLRRQTGLALRRGKRGQG